MSNLSIVSHYLAGTRPFTQLSMHISEKEKFRKDEEEWEIGGKQYKKENGNLEKKII